MLPGVYSVPGWRQHPHIAIRGALLAHPDGVLIGGAAAQASYWPSAPLDKIELAVPRKVTLRPDSFSAGSTSRPIWWCSARNYG